MAFTAPYAASKHAVEALADALRVELRTSGVQVALIEPGSVATPIWDKGRAEAEKVAIPPELAAQYGHVPAAMASEPEFDLVAFGDTWRAARGGRSLYDPKNERLKG